MNFASPIFLFAFLPLVLIAYHLLRPIRAKNVLLIAAGLVFYAFGDLRHLPLLLASCALHYGVGLALMRARRGRRLLLAACVTVDLAVLAAYKWRGALPLGISFYTFQAISYIVDVSRAPQSGTRSFRRALQYLTFFPQLTAGPLMRFSEVQPLLDTRHVTWDGAFDGCSRFICGLAKKLLLNATHPRYPISHIAYLSGFYDVGYFSRVFKKLEGVSPTEFSASPSGNNKVK